MTPSSASSSAEAATEVPISTLLDQFEDPVVKCLFGEDHAKKAAPLTRARLGTVRGHVEGLSGMNVEVKDCEVVGP